MQQRSIELRQVRSFDQVLSATFSFMRIVFKPLFKSLLIIAGPFLVAGGIVGGLSLGNVLALTGTTTFSEGDSGFAEFFGVVLGMLLLLTSCIVMFTATYAFILLYAESHGVPPTPGEVWRLTKKKVLRMVGTGIALILLTWLAEFIVFGALGIAGALLGGFIAGLITVGIVLAGMYIMVNISLIFIVRMQEPGGLSDAIARCFALVQGYWWQTCGIVVLMYVILMIIMYTSILLPVLFSVLPDTVTTSNESGTVYSILAVVTSILSIGVFLATSALFNIAVSIQYYNLVERKEAPGLRERVMALETAGGQPEVQQ